jgi:hypothetical protein
MLFFSYNKYIKINLASTDTDVAVYEIISSFVGFIEVILDI